MTLRFSKRMLNILKFVATYTVTLIWTLWKNQYELMTSSYYGARTLILNVFFIVVKYIKHKIYHLAIFKCIVLWN